MPAWKTRIAALAFVAGLSTLALAQAPARKTFPGGATGAYPASQTTGNLSDYYGMTPNFANYGFSGSYPGNGGFGYSAYGPGPQFGAHFPASPASIVPPAGKPATSSKNKPPTRSSNGTTRSKPLPRKGL